MLIKCCIESFNQVYKSSSASKALKQCSMKLCIGPSRLPSINTLIVKRKHFCRNYYQSTIHHNRNTIISYPANIHLDEDVLKNSFKTSFVFVFRRRLQDVLIKTNIFILVIRLPDVFKSSSVAEMSSRHLQNVLPWRLRKCL